MIEEVERLLAAGDAKAALVGLRDALAWPAGARIDPAELPRWIAVLAALAADGDGEGGEGGLSAAAARVVRDPDSPELLYALGYALIDAGAPAIAASVLWRCLALAGDSEQVVCELAAALESSLAYPDAFAILDARPALCARSFLCRYLRAFNAAMSGRLAIARDALPALAPAAPDEDGMAETIAAMLARADRVAGACPLDARDLRGWHYVLTGGLLVHQSPYGFDEPMLGRYAWLADSIAHVATGLARLRALVAGLALPCIYAPPGRDHEILASAAAAVLGLPLAPWPAVGVPAPGLVVLYDLAALERADAQRLVQRRPDQIVYAHASPWTRDSPVSPDVTTLLYQSLVPAADDRAPAEIVADIVASPGLDDTDLAADEPARWRSLVDRTWPPEPGVRARLWAGGPVPSSRFT